MTDLAVYRMRVSTVFGHGWTYGPWLAECRRCHWARHAPTWTAAMGLARYHCAERRAK